MLARLAATRRVAWIALISAIVFVITVLVSLLSGGSALPIKLHSPVITGAAGLACVISVLVGRPLPAILARLPAFSDPDRRRRIERAASDPGRRRRMTAMTAMIGITLLLDAGVAPPWPSCSDGPDFAPAARLADNC